ncbi:CYTH-like domain-containing protein [Lophiotrema nucula]|uniref:mRNA-capping enzyme subunit beta n=1 Tax=Lophiotrema nucula TaxID=690887 RepID=A0A6A5YVL0_9PLEO|nr:CYTH-like domain-containing protein [Lophiotrema nucula]
MDIAALVNPAPDAGPRRSLSNPHTSIPPSPATSAAKLPTPPLTNHKALPMDRKRKRHDSKPIWAVREDEEYEGLTLEQWRPKRRQLSLPPPPTPQIQHQPPPPPPPPPQSHPHPPPNGQTNGAAPPAARQLQGFERPVTDDPRVYDEISRKVCDFLWNNIVLNDAVRAVAREAPNTQIEIEARWGQLINHNESRRLVGIHETECVVNTHGLDGVSFQSTMNLEQHKKMNVFLNTHVRKSREGSGRPPIEYKHIKEIDKLYDLDQQGFQQLHPLVQRIIAETKVTQKIRVTTDATTHEHLRAIIKLRIANLEISSPQTEWDYRIGINLETQYPGPIANLVAKQDEPRLKDRMSYSWLGAYQIDLTQVLQGNRKNHELELELDAGKVLDEASKIERKQDSNFEEVVAGMMNNLRVLSREITSPVGQ